MIGEAVTLLVAALAVVGGVETIWRLVEKRRRR